MDTSPDKPRARQFSLRKLFLWVVVCAVYVCVLRLTEIELDRASIVTTWFAVLLIVRFYWGIRWSFFAVLVLAVAFACGWLWLNWSELFGWPIAFFVLVWFDACILGLLAFLFVNAVAYFVDWLDVVGCKSGPPDF
jgi:hypothetical protein